jgi:flavin-dependent dehydrogenase
VHTTLIDEKLAWEKPCGGGLSYKAWSRYPFLAGSAAAKRWVSHITLGAEGAGTARMQLDRPLLIYARKQLSALMLERAEQAGADIERTRALAVEHTSSAVRVRTPRGSIEADAFVLATGARNPLRDAGTEWGSRDAMIALGYYIETEQQHIDLQFLEGLHGYIWIFPRCGHVSAGICGKGQPAAALRARLEAYLSERGLAWQGARFFAHLLPSLEHSSWKRNRAAGHRWLACGDAAGMVDPITGEGIHYAIRSGELAAEALLERGPAEAAQQYKSALRTEFTHDLELGAAIAPRFYGGRFLAGSITARTVQFMRRSERFTRLMQEMFAGTQTYRGLSSRLWRQLPATLIEAAFGPRDTAANKPTESHETHPFGISSRTRP